MTGPAQLDLFAAAAVAPQAAGAPSTPALFDRLAELRDEGAALTLF